MLGNCETPFCGAGSGQYIQNKGDLPPHRSPFLYILTSPVTCFKEFRNCLEFLSVKGTMLRALYESDNRDGGMTMKSTRRGKVVSYNKWGYIFLIPFVVVYLVFSFIPLVSTIYNSFFENYRSGLTQIGPNFVGLENFKTILTSGEVWIYAKNTMIMWILGFIPQIVISLLLGAWFSDPSLRLKCQGFFKTVIYLPNLIMASAFAMLFFALFSDGGPINSLLMQAGLISTPFKFLSNVWSARFLVAAMNGYIHSLLRAV